MLKAYAVALVLSTATPVVADTQDGVKAPATQKEAATQPQAIKPSGGIYGGCKCGIHL
ncbi:hypothetical protein CA267_003220 [Alteromonas pelagimontana]|uniref:Uncharacterized protein n=1 Tax=Alteromonas pelagimontana TaxID=1858656 RepID=A0A6M4M9M7_9ALTE|nr:hypothetical protein [Alteromonas pelagimontana]QJR79863.1 hypothetical protein CA267_003220 [Alteromonas pelagimontana]